MKVFMFFLAIAIGLGGGWAIWPEIYKSLEKHRPVNQSAAAPKVKGGPKNAADVLKKKDPTSDGGTAQPAPGGDSENSPTTTTPPTTVPKPEPEPEDEYTRKYPMPKLPTIEQVTEGWTKIPPKAMPRKVVAKSPVEFVLAAGKTSVPAGTEIVALSLSDGLVVVARNEADTLRAQIPLTSTNLKEVLTSLYDAWKERRKKAVLDQRAVAKNAKEHPAPPLPTIDERTKIAGPMPVADDEGHYPEILASLRAKQVTEIKLEAIKSWGPIGFESLSGKGCWTCTVEAEIVSTFGPIDVEATAFIHKGKVINWLYTGSREPVQ